MRLDTYTKIILALFIAWLFFNSAVSFKAGKAAFHKKGTDYPDFYLYFNNTVPYRINVATGEVWIVNRDTGAWVKIAEPSK